MWLGNITPKEDNINKTVSEILNHTDAQLSCDRIICVPKGLSNTALPYCFLKYNVMALLDYHLQVELQKFHNWKAFL